jgi:Fic family protein
MTAKESTMSSMIEGTQATLTEVLKYEAGQNYSGEKKHDIQEIINYRSAMEHAVTLLNDRPFIHLNMIKEIHAALLDGVRGANKARGEFRKIQNWIGPPGSTLEAASFVPPAPNEIPDCLDDWEKFVNADYADILIQLGLIHAQFEIIHPFLDSNGRLGRILIPIFLYAKEYLTEPIFYLSEYFEAHRDEYYAKLNGITKDNDWQSWIEFFLTAVIEQSKTNTVKIKEIMRLYDEMKSVVPEITRSPHANKIIDTLFAKPIITTTVFSEYTGITNKNTASSILQKLTDEKLLVVIREARGSRANMYAFAELIALIEGEEFIMP